MIVMMTMMMMMMILYQEVVGDMKGELMELMQVTKSLQADEMFNC